MLEGREGAATAQVANEIIVTHGFKAIGGDSNDTRIYDIDTDTWFNPLPAPPPTAIRSELAGAAHGDLVYAVGGRSNASNCVGGAPLCKDLEVYDRVTNAWASLAPMPTARAGLAAAVVGNKLYAIGGRTGTTPGSGAPLSCLEAYNIAAGTWSPACGAPGALASMPVAAMDVAAIAHGGKIYVIGGAGGPDPAGPLLTTVQIYNVAKKTWSLGATMPTARANLALAQCGSVILALGGRTGPAAFGPAVNSAVVEAYEIPKNAWVGGLSPMPTAKSEHGAVNHGGKVYAIGSGIFGNPNDENEALACSSLFKK
jgi:N-acetylneuraminic acid mutarotase